MKIIKKEDCRPEVDCIYYLVESTSLIQLVEYFFYLKNKNYYDAWVRVDKMTNTSIEGVLRNGKQFSLYEYKTDDPGVYYFSGVRKWFAQRLLKAIMKFEENLQDLKNSDEYRMEFFWQQKTDADEQRRLNKIKSLKEHSDAENT